MVQWYWVNLQYWSVLQILTLVRQGPTALTVGAGGGCLDIFSVFYHFFSFSLSLGDSPIQKYYFKGLLSPKQPTNTEILFQRAVKPETTNQPTSF